MLDFFLNVRDSVTWEQALLDILIVSVIVYRVLLLIRGTRAVQMLTGFGVILIVYYLADRAQLHTVHTILFKFFNNLILILVIVFQEEIRKALTQVGRNPFFTTANTIEEIAVIEEVCQAAIALAHQRTGALLVLERETGLKNYIEAGTILDAKVTADLVVCVFHPESPIHDGAMIIRNQRVSSAGCFLPISRDPAVHKEFGTRHRAALGLTQETDAVVVVVSEERGEISVVHHGTVVRDLDAVRLREELLRLTGLESAERRSRKQREGAL